MIIRARSLSKSFATATLAFTLVACGGGGGNDSTSDESTGGSTVVDDGSDSTSDDSTGVSTADDGSNSTPDDSTDGSTADDGGNSTPDDSTDGSIADDGSNSTPDDGTDGSTADDGSNSTPDDSTDGSTADNDGSSSSDSGNQFIGPRIELEGSIYQTTDSLGRPHLFGVLKNTGNGSAVFVKARCSFFSADSALVEESFSYVIATNVVLTTIDATTNTALKPDETGVFEVAPFIESDEFSTYECKYTYDNANNTRDPDAKMELVGTVNVQQSYFGDIEYLGQVKNTGEKGLVFGQLYFVTRDTANSIVDVSFTYVNGDTVTLASIDTTTDTALNIGSTGTFSTSTRVPFSTYGQHLVMMAWSDSEITGGTARKSDRPVGKMLVDSEMEGRNERIDSLRDAYLAN